MSAAPTATAPLTIAVIKPCCIGDCVMAMPAIESLARAFPYAHIHAFTGRHSAPVLRASAFISRVYITPDQMTPSRVPGLAWNLRTAGHDWIVVLDRSRLVVAAARSANPARLVTIPRGKNRPQHEIDVYLDAVGRVGVKPATSVPIIDVPDDAREAARSALAGIESRYAVIQPGGAENPGTTMLHKRWPPDRHAAVVRQLSARGMRTVLTGGESDADLCERIARESGANAFSLAGKLDLMGTAAAIQTATLYLGTDTGVSHLAAAVETPSIVIFGPTNPERYAPRGEKVVVLAPEQSRALPNADLRKARSDDARPRTTEISIDAVIAEIDGILQRDTPGA